MTDLLDDAIHLAEWVYSLEYDEPFEPKEFNDAMERAKRILGMECEP